MATGRDDDNLAVAMSILSDSTECGISRRWASLLVERHSAGGSIANADEWLERMLEGMEPED